MLGAGGGGSSQVAHGLEDGVGSGNGNYIRLNICTFWST